MFFQGSRAVGCPSGLFKFPLALGRRQGKRGSQRPRPFSLGSYLLPGKHEKLQESTRDTASAVAVFP